MTEQVLPQVALTAPIKLAPEDILQGALLEYRADVASAAAAQVALLPTADWTPELLAGLVAEYLNGHSQKVRWLIGAAFRHSITQAHTRILLPVQQVRAARVADAAAEDFIQYFQNTSGNAVVDLFNLYVNHKVPAALAARKAVRAFGLTKPQMRGLSTLRDRPPVDSAQARAWRSLEPDYIEKAFSQRLKVLIPDSLRKVEHEAIQAAWSDGVADGTLPVTSVKVWFTAEDERTCPICAPMDRTYVRVDEEFELPDGNKVKTPPVHPNCRCTLELDQAGDTFAKAADFKPAEHPRGKAGRFIDAARKPNLAIQLEPGLAAKLGVRTSGVQATGSLRAAQGVAQGGGIQARGGIQASSGIQAAPQVSLTGGIQAAPTHEMPSAIVVGGQAINTKSLDIMRQVKIAQTVNTIEAGARIEDLPPEVQALPNQYVAVASLMDMDAVDYNGDQQDGYLQVETPLRFVNASDDRVVRAEVTRALRPMQRHLASVGVRGELDDLRGEPGSATRDLYDDLLGDAKAGGFRGDPDDLTFEIEPDDAVDAWKMVVLREQGQYPVVVKDAKGDVVGTSHAPEWLTASLSGNLSKRVLDFRPHVVIAPHGTWHTDSGVGATTRPPKNEGDAFDVSGPFTWKMRPGGIVEIVPDGYGIWGADDMIDPSIG